MADRIGMDPEVLEQHAEVLGEHGERLDDFTRSLRSTMMSHDPATGDPVGVEISANYHEAAIALLDGGTAAAQLLVGMSELVTHIAVHGRLVDNSLVRDVEDDEAGYDPVVGSKAWWDPDADPTGHNGGGTSGHVV